jgi:hypothetical protein
MAEISEEKALKWQALYDNMWGIFALGLLLPIVIYTLWGLVEITMMVPQMDVNKAMEALQPAVQAAPAEVVPAEAAPAEAVPAQ